MQAPKAWIILAVAAGAAPACRMTGNEKAAARTCKEHGNRSPECAAANRGLASGDPNLAGTIEQARQAAEGARRAAEEATQAGRAAVAAGQEPCEALLARVRAEFPAACETGAGAVVEDARHGAGCLAALGDWEATKDAVPDFLAECPAAEGN
ncbi:MAG: hypothetical protein QME96_00180 [Myxococcota bacterium]|nr:hypothetical protein [Myxococcota bacterium]